MGGPSLQNMLCLMDFLNLANQKTYYMSTCYLCSEPFFLPGEQRSPPPTVIIRPSVLLLAYRDILYTIPEEILTSNTITVEFAYGKHHDTRLDDRFIFAKATF